MRFSTDRSKAWLATTSIFLFVWTWYLTVLIREGGVPHPLIVSETMYADLETYAFYFLFLDLLFFISLFYWGRHFYHKVKN